MELVAFVVLAVAAISGLVGALVPSSRGHRIRFFALWFGVPALIFFGDELLAISYLHIRCGLEGGYRITKSVQTDGYFDGASHQGCDLACLSALLEKGFSYYELDVTRPSWEYRAFEKGIHRYFLADKSSNACARGKPTGLESRLLSSDKCIAVARIDQPTSRYEVQRPYLRLGDPGLFAQKIYSYVKDKTTGETIASAISFRYGGGWVANNSFGHGRGGECPSYTDSHAGIDKALVAHAK
jgi:hypothetical protein